MASSGQLVVWSVMGVFPFVGMCSRRGDSFVRFTPSDTRVTEHSGDAEFANVEDSCASDPLMPYLGIPHAEDDVYGQ